MRPEMGLRITTMLLYWATLAAGGSSFISRHADVLGFQEAHGQQTFRSAGCDHHEITLKCRNASELIVIENASLYAMSSGALRCEHGPVGPIPASALLAPFAQSLFPHLLGLPRVSRDLRQELNRRCSGVSMGRSCSFNLHLDEPSSQSWSQNGLVDIFFRCMTPSQSMCDSKSAKSQVLLRAESNGDSRMFASNEYPKYYVGGHECSWFLRAEPGQRIQLRLLDVSLRDEQSSYSASYASKCSDAVVVEEGSHTLLRMCGESRQDISLQSMGHTLRVSFLIKDRRRLVLARRGLLAEFWSVGCPTPDELRHGYVRRLNESHAELVCSVGFVFAASMVRSRNIVCHDRKWSDSQLDQCVDVDTLRREGDALTQERLKLLLPSWSRPHLSSELTRAWVAGVALPILIIIFVIIVILFALISALLIRRHLQLIRPRPLLPHLQIHRENEEEESNLPSARLEFAAATISTVRGLLERAHAKTGHVNLQ